MATFRARGEFLTQTDVVNLTATFYNQYGIPSNLDDGAIPTVSIIQPSGLVAMPPTSSGVMNVDTGKYLFQFTIPFNQAFYGVCQDVWAGTVDGVVSTQTLSFVVSPTELPMILSTTDGYCPTIALGDDPGFHYTQEEIFNINKLLKMLQARVANTGKAKTTDSFGNIIYVDCNVYSVDTMTTFLAMALSDFNQVPFFTTFRFSDTSFVEQFGEILVECATIYCLASQTILEAGRSFTINDNGVSFTPPPLQEILQTQWSTVLTNYYDKLKYIKASLRPKPVSLGTMGLLLGSPQLKRLRHIRERQII